MTLLWCGALALGASACGPEHEQAAGSYTLSLVEVLRDDCALSASADVAGPLVLQTAGDLVRLEYALFQARLTGYYLEKSETFTADGTVQNVTAVLAGQSCRLDLVQLHLEARTVSSTLFGGPLSVSVESEQAGCDCKLWAQYEARQ